MAAIRDLLQTGLREAPALRCGRGFALLSALHSPGARARITSAWTGPASSSASA